MNWGNGVRQIYSSIIAGSGIYVDDGIFDYII